MKKNKILILLCFFTTLHSTTPYAFDLISKEEHIQFLGNRSNKPKKMIYRSVFGEKNLPDITVEQPVIGKTIASPTNIKLSFKASADSKIDIDSLQFLYGWLSLDITDRIKENSIITVSSLIANNVTLPAGDHVIIVKVSDYDGRSKEKEIEFTIK